MQKVFCDKEGANAYSVIKAHFLKPEQINKLKNTGTTSNLESYHSSLYHKGLLDKDKNPQEIVFV